MAARVHFNKAKTERNLDVSVWYADLPAEVRMVAESSNRAEKDEQSKLAKAIQLHYGEKCQSVEVVRGFPMYSPKTLKVAEKKGDELSFVFEVKVNAPPNTEIENIEVARNFGENSYQVKGSTALNYYDYCQAFCSVAGARQWFVNNMNAINVAGLVERAQRQLESISSIKSMDDAWDQSMLFSSEIDRKGVTAETQQALQRFDLAIFHSMCGEYINTIKQGGASERLGAIIKKMEQLDQNLATAFKAAKDIASECQTTDEQCHLLEQLALPHLHSTPPSFVKDVKGGSLEVEPKSRF